MEFIGSGTFGTVFFDKKNNEAIKKCSHEDSRNIWAGNLREMDILKRCGEHPNILKLNSISMKEDSEYNKLLLHMKFYPNNLDAFVKSKKRIEISLVRNIICKILLGLEYLHANKVIHRDLKPDNILIDPETMDIAICDFGMSAVLMKYAKYDCKVTSPLYRAPEVYRENKYSSEIDIWAVGMIMYYLIQKENVYYFPQKEISEIENRMEVLYKRKSKNAQLELEALKIKINEIILNEIGKIDIKKSFGAGFSFRKLLEGLLHENPSKRLTATQALEDPFFDIVRENIINETRRKYPPEPIKLRKLVIEKIPERTWITKYTMKYINDNSKYEYINIYPIIFHGLDMFEKYLNFCSKNKITNSEGKYLSEKEVYLYLYTCFYISHKYYAVTEMPWDFEDFFPDNLIENDNMKKAEDFEEFMLQYVLNYSIFEYTLYEVADEFINNPDKNCYYKIIKEYLSITSEKTEKYNSYRSLYREKIMQKSKSD